MIRINSNQLACLERTRLRFGAHSPNLDPFLAGLGSSSRTIWREEPPRSSWRSSLCHRSSYTFVCLLCVEGMKYCRTALECLMAVFDDPTYTVHIIHATYLMVIYLETIRQTSIDDHLHLSWSLSYTPVYRNKLVNDHISFRYQRRSARTW